MGKDYSNTFRTFQSGKYQIIQDIETGAWVFRQLIPECKEGLETNFEELNRWFDWYESIKSRCAEIARNFEWSMSSPQYGWEADQTAEAIAKAIEEQA
jgi:hypothetical protein